MLAYPVVRKPGELLGRNVAHVVEDHIPNRTLLGLWLAGLAGRIGQDFIERSRTRASVETLFARAKAISLASSWGWSGRVMIMKRLSWSLSPESCAHVPKSILWL